MHKPMTFAERLIATAAIIFLFAIGLLVALQPIKHMYQKEASMPLPQQKPYEFPGGGRTLRDKYQFVALYGSVETPLLGVLGEQSASKSVERVKKLADSYKKYASHPIYPTFEIIATTAAGGPTENGDYSREASLQSLAPWIEKAKKSNVYVLLDLQPGRSDFLSQAKKYESLLRQPHVGLALDPEWRLGPRELPLQQIGHVRATEINSTSLWLSQLTTKYKLPEKLFLLHQFQLASLPDRAKILPRDNLVTIIQMDGQGNQHDKLETWNAVRNNPPKDTRFGWKNFYDEDTPTLSPKQTMKLKPAPWYVSYQ